MVAGGLKDRILDGVLQVLLSLGYLSAPSKYIEINGTLLIRVYYSQYIFSVGQLVWVFEALYQISSRRIWRKALSRWRLPFGFAEGFPMGEAYRRAGRGRCRSRADGVGADGLSVDELNR